MSTAMKEALHDSIRVSALMYGSQTWIWNEGERSGIQAVEMSHLKGACGVKRMDGECKESVYRRFDVCVKGDETNCGVQ